MLRSCSRVIALTAMVASPSMVAQAAEPTTLTLACQGTMTTAMERAKRERISMGIVVDFTARTVQGFGYPDSIRITRESEFTVDFADSKDDMSIIGIIDRVTRHVNATSFLMDPKIGKNKEISYALKCRPTQGMF
jgi:hypothetical protein